MSSASSSGASLARSQSNGSSRRPRPRSPPSMYVAYESSIAKPPKPLLKLDKKPKKGLKTQAPPLPDLPNPFPAQNYTSTSSPTVSDPLQRRPSAPSFSSLRRKTVSHAPSSIPPSGRIIVAMRNRSPGSSHRTPYPSQQVQLHEANVHPVDDIEPVFRRSDKAARLLGEASGSRLSDADSKVVVSDFSGVFRISPHSSAIDGEASSSDGRSSVDESFEDECYRDDSHTQRESAFLTPMEFASPRPQSVTLTRWREPSGSDTASRDEDDERAEPITPIAALPPSTPPDRYDQSQFESYGDHDRPYPQHSRHFSLIHESPLPDTPFLDTLVAVDSQVLVARSGTGRTHGRKLSVIRAEPKEGWMGEWNQGGMQDVLHKLRSLK
ncbi:hypothetical protein C8F04DRAFT_1078929 [Mycena alexandri]|uniref:Uncharacterized protein n=1 Tax=Mycena alexandri TaxID=1745969 RepID=A0AAD6RXK2_9AGAR|nr:hypothetical protein C8F04DRAFT_1157800 [Mycena alexandri]KAJ7041850.1 hypothetical protein C8F04DRAFT_1078929 [Mycena alexandri]